MKTQLALLLLCLAPALKAQPCCIVSVENALRAYPLDPHTLVFADSTEALTFEVVRKLGFQEKFHALETPVVRKSLHRVFWLKTQIAALDSLDDWMLLLKNPFNKKLPGRSEYAAGNEYVDVWFTLQNGETTHHRDGFLLPKNQRKVYLQPLTNALPFALKKGDTATVFVRVHNPKGNPAALSLELRPSSLEIPFGKSNMSTLMGTHMGVTGILAMLCFFFYLAGRDSANLFFSIFCTLLMAHYSLIHPELLFVSWFIPQSPWLAEYIWIFLTIGTFFWFILFGRAFVNLRQHSLLLDRLMLGLAGVAVLIMVFSFLNYGLGWEQKTGVWLIALVIAVLTLVIRIGFYKSTLAKIYAAGAGWLLLFTILGLSLEREVFALFNPWSIGQMGLMVIYTFGLAYKMQLNERTKSDALRVLELDAVKSRFFANISHEFRTPLTLILGPLKKAIEQLPASEQDAFSQNEKVLEAPSHRDREAAEISLPARHVGMMRRNAERLGQLIDQLLDLSKLENGRLNLQVAEGDVVKFLRAMAFSFESLAERRQIHYQTTFTEEGQMAFFDKDKLEKIIVNLLSNAFKYTPVKGSVSVKILLENGRLKISVEDSGPGISKEDLDKIFQRFYQVEGMEDKGTGIGLNLVKELVELHHGQISVESAQGKGTMFKVSLPVTREAFAGSEISTRPFAEMGVATLSPTHFPTCEAETEDLAPHSLEPTNHPLLLIVEDNPDLRSFIGENLKGEYQILTAENGKKGLETALDRIPDLVISDVMMPEMDGFKLCETLKKDERTSHIPVILLTAKAGQQQLLAGLETGADAYMTKPFDEQELLVRARNLVEQRRELRKRFSNLANAQSFLSLSPSEVAVTSSDHRFLEKVTTAIEENMDNEFFSVEDLANAVSFSRSQLHRKLKALTGKSPNELIRDFRLTRAKELLDKGAGNVSEVAMEVGYSSLSYFTRSFKEMFGVLPSEI
ncbi:MAG: Sensor histidine kinase RcsC [Saprospiraceae bacterium]|nr:Sensor histidine kinase RcsC [Saprospiraceae bacterium]